MPHHRTVDLGSSDTSYKLKGNHVTVTGTGNDTINGHHTSHDVITLGNGNDQITITGNHNTIILGNGIDNVTIKGNHDTVILGDGIGDNVTISGNHDKVTLGNGTGVVSLGAHSVHDHVTVGSGSYMITTVAGDNFNSFDLDAGTSNLTLHGNHNFVFVDGGTDTITDSASGKDHLKLSVGSAGGTIDITNFSAAHGVVDLDSALGFASGADAAGALLADGFGGSMLTFTGGSIDFQGVAPASLDAGNFFVI
jgi:hypothetical protein